MGLEVYFQQEMPAFQHRINTYAWQRHTRDTVTRHETWQDMETQDMSKDKTYKCQDWAKTKTETMSRDILERRHVSREVLVKGDMQCFFTKLMKNLFLAAYCNIKPSV